MAKTTEKRDYRQEITDAFIEKLRTGTAPWQKQWNGNIGAPANAETGKPYRGGNRLTLTMAQVSMGTDDNRWMTYNQAKNAGMQVKAGSKGVALEKWIFPEKDTKQADAGDDNAAPSNKTAGRQPFAKTFTVFHASQIEGMPPLERADKAFNQVERAEALLKASGAKITHDGGDRAFYSVTEDAIRLPHKNAFKNEQAYYATALHELGHWTGAEHRMAREGFGDDRLGDMKVRAREELVAEIASTFMQTETGLQPDMDNHAAYVDSWIEMLQGDKNTLFRAARDAEAATDYVLALHQAQEQEHLVRLDATIESCAAQEPIQDAPATSRGAALRARAASIATAGQTTAATANVEHCHE